MLRDHRHTFRARRSSSARSSQPRARGFWTRSSAGCRLSKPEGLEWLLFRQYRLVGVKVLPPQALVGDVSGSWTPKRMQALFRAFGQYLTYFLGPASYLNEYGKYGTRSTARIRARCISTSLCCTSCAKRRKQTPLLVGYGACLYLGRLFPRSLVDVMRLTCSWQRERL